MRAPRLLILGVVSLLLAGCGIPSDPPREAGVGPDTHPSIAGGLESHGDVPSPRGWELSEPGLEVFAVLLLDGATPVWVDRELVPASSAPVVGAIEAVAEPLIGDEGVGGRSLTTEVHPSTIVHSATMTGVVLTLDLSEHAATGGTDTALSLRTLQLGCTALRAEERASEVRVLADARPITTIDRTSCPDE